MLAAEAAFLTQTHPEQECAKLELQIGSLQFSIHGFAMVPCGPGLCGNDAFALSTVLAPEMIQPRPSLFALPRVSHPYLDPLSKT